KPHSSSRGQIWPVELRSQRKAPGKPQTLDLRVIKRGVEVNQPRPVANPPPMAAVSTKVEMLDQTPVILIGQNGVDYVNLKGRIRQRVKRPFEGRYGLRVEARKAADGRARRTHRDLCPRMIEHQLGERQPAITEDRTVAKDGANIVEGRHLDAVGSNPRLFEDHHEMGAEAYPRARDANREAGAIINSRQRDLGDFALIADDQGQRGDKNDQRKQ